MPLATLNDVLPVANGEGRAVAGLVCLGWEDALAYAEAAEAEDAPVILQAGPSARAHMPLAVWGAIFRHLAERVSIPLVAHLDHGASMEDCAAAIAHGFSSVMFDGSRLPLRENIARTREVARMAQAEGVSCEGEIGFVGYAERAGDGASGGTGGEAGTGVVSQPTDPIEAARFAEETGVDALAVSVGNVHLKTDRDTPIDYVRLAAIQAGARVPLVLHGASGIAPADRERIAARSAVAKFNIGTQLRQVFGATLREGLARHPARFDRIAILSETIAPLREAARRAIRELHEPLPPAD